MTKERLLEIREQAKNFSDRSVIPDLLAHIYELERRLGIAEEVLVWCSEMLQARDVMNSAIHCAPVRYSPITERVELALQELRRDRGEE